MADRPDVMISKMRPLWAVAAVLIVSGCSTSSPLKCPAAAVLVDTSTQTMFRAGAAPSPANALYTVQIQKVDSDCTVYKYEHSVDASIDIDFTATRKSSGSAAQYSVPYFVAVTQGDHIINKKRYVAQFSFDEGQTTASFSDTVDSTEVHLANGKQAYDYSLFVGIQLTKEQVDYNRSVGRYPK